MSLFWDFISWTFTWHYPFIDKFIKSFIFATPLHSLYVCVILLDNYNLWNTDTSRRSKLPYRIHVRHQYSITSEYVSDTLRYFNFIMFNLIKFWILPEIRILYGYFLICKGTRMLCNVLSIDRASLLHRDYSLLATLCLMNWRWLPVFLL